MGKLVLWRETLLLFSNTIAELEGRDRSLDSAPDHQILLLLLFYTPLANVHHCAIHPIVDNAFFSPTATLNGSSPIRRRREDTGWRGRNNYPNSFIPSLKRSHPSLSPPHDDLAYTGAKRLATRPSRRKRKGRELLSEAAEESPRYTILLDSG